MSTRPATTAINPPRIRKDLLPAGAALLQVDASLEGVQFAHLQADVVAPNMQWDELRFEKCELLGAQFGKVVASDIELAHCDFSAGKFDDGSFIRAVFSDCRLSGLDCGKTQFKDVVFKNCQLGMANFRFATFTNVDFIDCNLAEADCMGATFRRVAFAGSDLAQAEFSQCKVHSLDLRGAELAGLKGWTSLKGVTIDGVQLTAVAPYLAAELGLTVD